MRGTAPDRSPGRADSSTTAAAPAVALAPEAVSEHPEVPAGPQRSRGGAPVPQQDVQSLADVELVARLAAGDLEQPLNELVARHKDMLFRYGLSMLGDHWLAEELVHETFIRLWRTAGRFDAERAGVRTYLCMIARTTAVDIVRRSRSRSGTRQRDTVSMDELTAEAPVADNTKRVVERLTMRQALDGLSPAHREVLVLAHWGGLTQTEIASVLHIPHGTVKTRMFHGLRALRDILQGWTDDE